jgi:hypothetical protein
MTLELVTESTAPSPPPFPKHLFSIRQICGAAPERVPKARRNKARSAAKRSSGLPKPVDQIPNPAGVTEALRERWVHRTGLDGDHSAALSGLISFWNDSRSSAGASLRALLAPHLRCLQS